MTDARLPTYRLDDGSPSSRSTTARPTPSATASLDALDDALDRAEAEAPGAVVIVGPARARSPPASTSPTMTESTEAMRGLVVRGAAARSCASTASGLPTVAACTGHALAAGALLLLSLDQRVGADGPAKIGLNEVAIGMALPIFAVELARERLTTAELTAGHDRRPASTTPPARSPPATSTGWSPPTTCSTEAIADAQRLGELRTGAYARTKAVLRESVIGYILDTLEDRHGHPHRPRGLTPQQPQFGSVLRALAASTTQIGRTAATWVSPADTGRTDDPNRRGGAQTRRASSTRLIS